MPGDDELTIDFGKIAGWFRRKKKPLPDGSEKSLPPVQDSAAGTRAGQGSDELGIDFSRFFSWVKKYPVLVILAVLLVMQFVPNHFTVLGKNVYLPWGGIWMRMNTENLPSTDSWAENHVFGALKGQIANAVAGQYPNLPDERRNSIIEEEWKKLYSQQKSAIDQQVDSVRQQIKAFWQYEQDGRTYTYMPDIDPYQWLRYARNIIEKGTPADETRNSRKWDNHMVAPLGAPVPDELTPYVIALLHRIFSVVRPHIPLMQSATYLPLVFILISIVPAFLLGRKLAGNIGGIAAATMIAVNTAIFTRTMWGHADTDGYNVFFPVLCTLLFFSALDAKSIRQQLLYSAGLGLSLGLYAWLWPAGWWYVFDFILVSLAALVAYEVFTGIRRHSVLLLFGLINRAVLVAGILVSTGFFVTLFRGFRDFLIAPMQPLHFAVIKAAAHISLWPNVYTTVAELNPINISGAIVAAGGKVIFIMALLGIALLFFRRSDGRLNPDVAKGVFLLAWVFAALYATTKGVRFTLMLAPVISLCFGIALGRLCTVISDLAHKELRMKHGIALGIVALASIFFFVAPVRGSYGNSFGDMPLVNDAWWNALTKIRQDSQPDAIINSWWDFGHHFKYIADRAVTFDGASQNTPMAHWIGRVLATEKEGEAVGILRMLDCGSNSAFEEVNKRLNDSAGSVKLLYSVVASDRQKAGLLLSQAGIDEPEKILQLTHCEPPEDYFIASDDMIGKSGVWSHFGLWNFERARLWMELKSLPKDKAVSIMVADWNYSVGQAEQAYFEVQSISSEEQANGWISPWPGIMGSASDCSVQQSVVVCGNGILHNLSSGTTIARTPQGDGRPAKVIVLREDGRFSEQKINDSNMGAGVLLYPTGPESFKSILASPELLESMFIRLYFLEGHGLHHFREFDRQQMITGGQIITYKIDWIGSSEKTFSGIAAIKEAKSGSAKQGDTASVLYTGALLDNTVFDSSIKGWKEKNITIDTSFDSQQLDEPLSFVIGSGAVIPGFDAAVRGMKPGQEQVINIPPASAYGTDPAAHLLGNQTLRFRIRLVSLKAA